jgi:hypothetical protein
MYYSGFLPHDTLLILISLLFFFSGVFVLYRLFRRIYLTKVRRSDEKRQLRMVSLHSSVIWGLASLLLMAIGLAVFWFTMALRAYHIFTKEELVAIVKCVPGEEDKSLLFNYTEVVNDERKQTRQYMLKGDQWMVDGDILKWDSWVNFLGIHTCYKTTRISSRYIDVKDETSQPRTAYELNDGTDLLWKMLYRNGQGFPFVEAVYGSATYQFPDENAVFGIYVTTSGYMTKRMSQESLL